jgi:hypothetical protein
MYSFLFKVKVSLEKRWRARRPSPAQAYLFRASELRSAALRSSPAGAAPLSRKSTFLSAAGARRGRGTSGAAGQRDEHRTEALPLDAVKVVHAVALAPQL